MKPVGTWRLVSWRRHEGETCSLPLGEGAIGMLIYAEDGTMAVQMVSRDRPAIATADALGGDPAARAAAYSTCLAYFGTYAVEGESIIHRVEASLFPNWSGTVQTRPFTGDGDRLTLRTPPTDGPNGPIVNELIWGRDGHEAGA